MPGHLQLVVELHHTVTDLQAAHERLHGIPDWMRELHEEHAGRNRRIEEMEAAVEAARQQRRLAEGQVEEAREKQRRYQQQINQVSTQREYGALLQEIDTVKQQAGAGEESALAAMEQIDQLNGELAAERESFRELDERYAAEQRKWEAEKPGVAAEVADLEGRVAALREQLPRNVLAQFDRISERLDGGPLATIRRVERPGRGPIEWHCGACNYRVRPQVVVQVRNSGELVQCESCKRILYIKEAE
jgi:hypothetical protein